MAVNDVSYETEAKKRVAGPGSEGTSGLAPASRLTCNSPLPRRPRPGASARSPYPIESVIVPAPAFLDSPTVSEESILPEAGAATVANTEMARLIRWIGTNQKVLSGHIRRITGYLSVPRGKSVPLPKSETRWATTLDRLCLRCGLTAFERDTLLLAAAPELDGTAAAALSELTGDGHQPLPTFSLALACLPEPEWNALTPHGPLRRYGLVELLPNDGPLTLAALRIDEWILHYLAGVDEPDSRLPGARERPGPSDGLLAACHARTTERILRLWKDSTLVHEDATLARMEALTVQLCGDSGADKREIARRVAAARGVPLRTVTAVELPIGRSEQEEFLRRRAREAALEGTILFLDGDDLPVGSDDIKYDWSNLLEVVAPPLLIATPSRLDLRRASTVAEVDTAQPTEQVAVWAEFFARESARGKSVPTESEVRSLAVQFALAAPMLDAVAREVDADIAAGIPNDAPPSFGSEPSGRYWDACRRQARPRLDALARRVGIDTHPEHLILPTAQYEILDAIVAHAQSRATVLLEWQFGGRSPGVTALFAGDSGTGKTLAAEVLAAELRLDLYRVDLSTVVSKYIGETEKNLKQVFAAAESGGAVLLFDEADALFGKRSEVKDSHDRHANIEVNYLLQRLETFRGVAVLTTNLKKSLDPAFLRRFNYVLDFPFPGYAERLAIWERVFPLTVPLAPDFDATRAAQLNVAGGNIRSIARNAAFLATRDGGAVGLRHVRRAARAEYAKLERSLSDSELRGWPTQNDAEIADDPRTRG